MGRGTGLGVDQHYANASDPERFRPLTAVNQIFTVVPRGRGVILVIEAIAPSLSLMKRANALIWRISPDGRQILYSLLK